MKIKEQSKPEYFKLLKQIKLLRKKFMCIKHQTENASPPGLTH